MLDSPPDIGQRFIALNEYFIVIGWTKRGPDERGYVHCWTRDAEFVLGRNEKHHGSPRLLCEPIERVQLVLQAPSRRSRKRNAVEENWRSFMLTDVERRAARNRVGQPLSYEQLQNGIL